MDACSVLVKRLVPVLGCVWPRPGLWLVVAAEGWMLTACPMLSVALSMATWLGNVTPWITGWLWVLKLPAKETGIWKRAGWPTWPAWSWIGAERM